jgi:hypothetical protein
VNRGKRVFRRGVTVAFTFSRNYIEADVLPGQIHCGAMGLGDKQYGCSLRPPLPRQGRQMVAALLRLPPADGADRAIGAPVQPGAAVGSTGEPLDRGQLTGQALAVDGGSGGGGFRHGRSDAAEVEIANCSIAFFGGVSGQREDYSPKALVVG